MNLTKSKLAAGEVAVGGWIMTANATIAELMAGEDFDWICVDMEHTAADYAALEHICRAVKASGKEVLARLHGHDAVMAKKVLDLGCAGIIVPNVNTRAEAEFAVAMAKYPPDGIRGASLARCTDYGRDFARYFTRHNDSVLVAVMLEHVDAVANADEILSVAGIDAMFIGPYDLSASMNLAGQLDHPAVCSAQQHFLECSGRHGVAPGLHVVPTEPQRVQACLEAGFRFIALGLDTRFIIDGCRRMLEGVAR
jgi:2-keto-3-deoxy-L-rhamnonate aldolase RhmA